MVKIHKTITLDSELVDAISEININVSQVCNSALSRFLLLEKQDLAGISLLELENDLQKALKKRQKWVKKVDLLLKTKEKLIKIKEKKAEEVIKMEKKTIEEGKTCKICTNLIKDPDQIVNTRKGIICKNCFRDKPPEELKDYF